MKKMKLSSIESIILFLLFLLSFINTIFLIFFIISTLYFLKYKEIGALKIIFILTLRSILNPGIAISIGSFQSIKIMIIFILSLFLMNAYFKLNKQKQNNLKLLIVSISIFIIYHIIIAFFISSLPVVAASKAISYGVVFLGIIIGVYYTIEKFDIFNWMLQWFKFICAFSLILIPLPVGYLVNGWSFQGLLNHPNLFGIVGVMIFTMILGRNNGKNYNFNISDYFFLISLVVMISLSNSRTALICLLVVGGLYILVGIINKPSYLKIAMLIFSLVFLILTMRPIINFIYEYILKGQDADSVLSSRTNQIEGVIYDIQQSPLLGNGFGVPVLPSKSYDFSYEYIVEPGNLILAVLAYGGIIGFLIFLWYMLNILFINKLNFLKKPYLYIAPIMISMGEMVFFSSNSVGIFCFFLLTMYMFYNSNDEVKTAHYDMSP